MNQILSAQCEPPHLLPVHSAGDHRNSYYDATTPKKRSCKKRATKSCRSTNAPCRKAPNTSNYCVETNLLTTHSKVQAPATTSLTQLQFQTQQPTEPPSASLEIATTRRPQLPWKPKSHTTQA
ncbi:hypothetical protein DEO72_LG2g4504 [Vigna unguiculata]|uniref:Uncharacterized protein n=1 Tax=Vigna unguiculata TaxID=3917 RepID=A0A4D6L6V7_VIGUN|nr:hypothetical protein DEO72_LG2g4504 [Vigna unguiculata]